MRSKKTVTCTLVLSALLLVQHASYASDFTETFAISTDRSRSLRGLVRGTKAYFYYHALHQQNLGNLRKAEELMERWRQRFPYDTARRKVLYTRQLMLRYPKAPKLALGFLKKALRLSFSSRRPVHVATHKASALPTRLDPRRIDRGQWIQEQLQKKGHIGDSFEPSLWGKVASHTWTSSQKRHFLHRLKTPDLPGLAAMIADDLQSAPKIEFGHHKIHHSLTREQLKELKKRRPAVARSSVFVSGMLRALLPSADGATGSDARQDRAYLLRVWRYVRGLSPRYNGLKRLSLFHLLEHHRRRGRYRWALFRRYLRLPRARYSSPHLKFVQTARAALHPSVAASLSLPRSLHEGPLLEAYIRRYLPRKKGVFQRYFRKEYLQRQLAELRLTQGASYSPQWQKLLGPADFNRLKKKVELHFHDHNKQSYSSRSPVVVRLVVKNVPTLIVKVYKLNPLTYYRARNRSLALGGLIPHKERVYRFKTAPIRRLRRTFRFPYLRARGLYLLDFLGNGKASRVLIRKGKLFATQRLSAAGHAFRVFDESGTHLKKARIWLGQRQFTPNEQGEIYLPFTNEPGRRTLLLQHGSFASPFGFTQRKEAYALHAGIYVDRESLLAGRVAKVLVRPMLRVQGIPTTTRLLRNASLQITSIDRFGIRSIKTFAPFALHDHRESVVSFRVPRNLRRLHVALKAQIFNLSQNKYQQLSQGRSFWLNEIDTSRQLSSWHLSRAGGAYILSLRDKSGNPIGHRRMTLTVKLRGIKQPRSFDLQTDGNGGIGLGALKHVEKLTASSLGSLREWRLRRDRLQLPSVLHGRAKQALSIPYIGPAKAPTREEFSLLELRRGYFVADHFKALHMAGGYLHIQGLGAGDYRLSIRSLGQVIQLRIARGPRQGPVVAGERRLLQAPQTRLMHLWKLQVGAQKITLKLSQTSPQTRVHVLATRFLPRYDLFAALSARTLPAPQTVALRVPRSSYESERSLSHELRYILERRYASKYPGNMLPMPSLLLQPWRRLPKRRSFGLGGLGAYGRGAGGGGGARGSGRGLGAYGRGGRISRRIYPPNLDFLPHTSLLKTHLKPDAKGELHLPRSWFRRHPHLHLLALDRQSAVYRQLSLPGAPLKVLDLRLKKGLSPKGHFAQEMKILKLQKGQRFTRPKAKGGLGKTAQIVGDLRQVYRLFLALHASESLRQFRFILGWKTMSDKQKKRWFGKFSCHELHFFLYKKDPAFFAKVVRPYLKNKKHKTFLDHWLLGRDLSRYGKPWHFQRLNVVERILLGQRMPALQSRLRRHLQELYQSNPTTPEREYQLFHTALHGNALDARPDHDTGGGGDSSSSKAHHPETPGLQDTLRWKQTQRQHKALKAQLLRAPAAQRQALKAKLQRLSIQLHMLRARLNLRRLYRAPGQPKEWRETHYYRRSLAKQVASLIPINAFWRDLALHRKGPFLSRHVAQASRNFSEMMFALSFLDLPFATPSHKPTSRRAQPAASPRLVYLKLLRPTRRGKSQAGLLVRQYFFAPGDSRHKSPKEYLPQKVYGSQIVVTNPSATHQTLDLLFQIPQGALPVANGRMTYSRRIQLGPFRTYQLRYYFAFPKVGTFQHFPLHVTQRGRWIAAAQTGRFRVVQKLAQIDPNSWYTLAQYGTQAQVLRYLNSRRLQGISFSPMLWRLKHKGFFLKIVALLRSRFVYRSQVWSYGLYHNHLPTLRTYLQHRPDFIARCGSYLKSPLLSIHPQTRRLYQHLEYGPLINPRAHPTGRGQRIKHPEFLRQYKRFTELLKFKPRLDHEDRMALTYYLLLQGRIREAITHFRRISPRRLATRLQYDYFWAYMQFYTRRPARARKIARKYRNHPVARWRKRFLAVLRQLREIRGRPASRLEPDILTQLEPSFQFKTRGRGLLLRYQNIKRFRINYYLMDIELLFSRNPFAFKHSKHFSLMKPNYTTQLRASKSGRMRIRLPRRFANRNAIIEVVAAGQRQAKAHYANRLDVQMLTNLGQLRVLHEHTRRPLAQVYIKVYARSKGGDVRFYKDGYTDHRGRFDYASLNVQHIRASRFAVLVLSPHHGAMIHEVGPPLQ